MISGYTQDEIEGLLPFLSKEELAELYALLPIFIPNPGRQTQALETEADELFYGGAAGGGKSYLLLGAAATQHRRSLILRRTAKQLGALKNTSRKIIGTKGKLNQVSGEYKLDDGRLIELGGCQHEQDKENYQGQDHDLKGFDEITHFTKSQYEYIIGWNRTDIVGQRTRVIVTGNPPTTPEGEWVLQRWAAWLDPQHPNPAEPGELRWYTNINGEDVECKDNTPFTYFNKERGKEELAEPKSRTFIPAKLEDNPIYERTGYRSRLQAMPEPLRSQMLYGDFGAGLQDDAWQVIPTAWVELAFQRWRDLEKQGFKTSTILSALGVDVARGGSDKTVLARRYNNWFAPLESYQGVQTDDGPKVAALIVKAMTGIDYTKIPVNLQPYINVDVIGVGSSAYDSVKHTLKRVIPVNFAAKPYGKDRAKVLTFKNLRAYAVWRFREMLDPNNGENIALPPSSELKADLCAPRYSLTAGGIQIESKDDIKKRIGRSPDMGDAVVMAALEARNNTLIEFD